MAGGGIQKPENQEADALLVAAWLLNSPVCYAQFHFAGAQLLPESLLLPEPGHQLGGALLHADARSVSEIAARGRDVEPMIFRQFIGHKARHGRLAAHGQKAPRPLARRAERRGCAQ